MRSPDRRLLLPLLGLFLAALACNLPATLVQPTPTNLPRIIWLTNTPTPASGAEGDSPAGEGATGGAETPGDEPSTPLSLGPVTLTPQPETVNTAPYLYYAQAGDTLPALAVRFSVDPDEITSPQPIPPNALIRPGQLLIIPRQLFNTTSPQHIIPDSEVVYAPSAADFDVRAYVEEAGGFLSSYRQYLGSTGWTDGAEVVSRVALENSINPRLLLSLIEYQSGMVFGKPEDPQVLDYPLGLRDPNRKGLYSQLNWAVGHISTGYYGWREGRLTEIVFKDGVTARLAPDLNAGSVAMQYLFAQLYDSQEWAQVVEPKTGWPSLHENMFYSPWLRARETEPLFPPSLTQPEMILPFLIGQVWSFSGGPHGAWGKEGAYAALDFAPASIEAGCVPSDHWVVAAAPGLITRFGNGVLVLDLDGDGREQTGWALMYLHISRDSPVEVGEWVERGDLLGHPSCEGGFATGTHIHIARKYNGEWVPAGGAIPFTLSGWVASGGEKAYKGSLTRDGVTIEANFFGTYDTRISRQRDEP